LNSERSAVDRKQRYRRFLEKNILSLKVFARWRHVASVKNSLQRQRAYVKEAV
jgi:hypothetical protein